jgi:LmbE family N-acetylglucosaminyl deacetylase
VLVVCLGLAGVVTLGYVPAQGFGPFLALSLGHAAALAPVTILADALALGAAAPPPGSGRRGFEYGWVRGTGSAAFIGGTLLSGQAVSAWGLDVIVGLQALLLGTAAGAALVVPELWHARATEAVRAPAGGVRQLLRLPRFRRLVLVAALILGSHAMHDAFAVIRWRAAGVSPAIVSVLWSESVAAEVLVFFLLGPALVTWLTPAGALVIAALAGLVRWTVMTQSTAVLALALIRQAELARAAALLGVTHVYQLGYHDSGMAGWASNQERQAFVQAPLEDVTGRVVPLIRRHRPDVVVTYDAHGGYGHPDHIMTHRVTMASVTAAAVADRFPEGGAPWQVRKVYAVVWPQSVVRRAIQVMRVLERCGLLTPLREPHVDPTVIGCPDALITTRIDVRSVLRAKWAALGAHRSQMGRLGRFVWVCQLVSRWLWPAETFQCVQSVRPIQPPETDIFAGL